MNKIFYIFIFITIPYIVNAQQSAKNKVGIDNYFEKLDVNIIKIEKDSIPFVYNNNILLFNTYLKFKFCHITSSDNETVKRAYIRNNQIRVKLLPNQKYYLRLDTEFSKKYYIIKP